MAKRKRRTFTAEFKTEVVLEALTGESSQAELCRRHNLSEDQLSKWKQHFLENAVSVFSPTDPQSNKDAKRIAHLERLVGRMGMLKDSSERSRRKKFISTTIRTSMKREIASVILSHRCIIKNAYTRR